MSSTHVTPSTYSRSDFKFKKPKVCTITTKEKDANTGAITEQTISYRRMFIFYKGQKEWTFKLPECFSFGVQRKIMSGRPKWTVSAVLFERDGATPEQQAFVDMFNDYVDFVKDHLVEIREDIGTADLEARDLRGLNPIYLKKDKKTGKVVEDASPTLYPSLNHTGDNVDTDFYNEDDEPVPLNNLISTDEEKNYFTLVESVLCANNVYIGGKNNMNSKVQCTLEEAIIRQKQKRKNRLLGNGGVRRKWQPPKDTPADTVKIEGAEEENAPPSTPPPEKTLSDSSDESDGEKSPPPAPKKPPVRKTAAAVRKPPPKKKAAKVDDDSD